MKWTAAVRADLYRLACSRPWWLAALLPAVAGAVRIGSGRIAARVEDARRLAQGFEGGAAGATGNGFGPLADGLRTGGAVLALIALLSGALLWVRDRENRTLALQFLIRRRSSVVLAKVAVLTVFVSIAMLALTVTCIVSSAAFYDLEAIVEDGFEMAPARELWIDTAGGVGAVVPALFAAAIFGLFVSVLCSTSGAAVAGTLVPFVLFDLLQGLFGGLGEKLFVRFVPFLGEHSSLARLTEVARAYSDAGWEPGELASAALLPAVQAVLLVALSCLAARAKAP